MRDLPLSNKEMVISEPSIKKDTFLSDKLVSNPAGDGKVWEYPPLSLLSESQGQKAERGDVNKVAKTIEETLESFNIRARVAEVNLGPAVTQYALEIAQRNFFYFLARGVISLERKMWELLVYFKHSFVL